jgi:YfiH family protein
MFEVDLPGARAVFTIRQGGSSSGPYASRNLGLKTDDDRSVVRKNLQQLQAELELEELHLLDQVHGATVIDAEEPQPERRPIADGAITTTSGRGLLITGADCPAVILASENRLAALHCGWRPVAAGIIETATAQFAGEEFDAAIGPGICQQHFEVGTEVIEALAPDGEEFSAGRQLDLSAVIRARLGRGGAGRIHQIERCTYCEPELFFSHRRDGGVTGRQAGVAWRI